ncbi:MAG: hypothetical protein ACE5GS_13405 [Kiloniellaceae bacterium]
MRIVIEQSEFRRLSSETQREVLETFAGRRVFTPPPAKKHANLLWRQPFDLTPDLAARLLHGLAEPHRARLRLFAERGGRVSQKELLAATQDGEMRVLSHFQAVLSRRLRRFIDDPEKKAHLIGWDFSATEWDGDHNKIVDGIYYVTETTARTLRDYFGIGARNRART